MLNQSKQDLSALILRIGLGLVFIIGGISKLSQLLDPQRSQAILDSYWGTSGYVNQFFIDFMFSENGLQPWWFLTSLSWFELISGLMLVSGLWVRPLSLLYGFLLWSFIIALPVVTTPEVNVSVKTYMAPALFVQIRDVALSGMMFVLYSLGSGAYSLDRRLFKLEDRASDWNNLGLLLRLSIFAPLIVAGVFFGMANIPSFASSPLILVPLALWLISGKGLRIGGGVLVLTMLWFMLQKLNADKSLIANLNGFKREFAFIALGVVLSFFGGGATYTLDKLVARLKGMLFNRTHTTN